MHVRACSEERATAAWQAVFNSRCDRISVDTLAIVVDDLQFTCVLQYLKDKQQVELWGDWVASKVKTEANRWAIVMHCDTLWNRQSLYRCEVPTYVMIVDAHVAHEAIRRAKECGDMLRFFAVWP